MRSKAEKLKFEELYLGSGKPKQCQSFTSQGSEKIVNSIHSLQKLDLKLKKRINPAESETESTHEGQSQIEDGRGILVLPDGSKYDGTFKDNKYHGMGTLYYANGDRYTGDWACNKRQGWGVYKHANGMKYAGEWNEDLKDGFGRTEYPDGTFYEGKHSQGKPHEQPKQFNTNRENI